MQRLQIISLLCDSMNNSLPKNSAVKVDRHGQSKILTHAEIQWLFEEGLVENPLRDRALFAICLYSACRVNECVTLHVKDVYDRSGRIRPALMIRKGHTKGKLDTRTIPVIEDLRSILQAYRPPEKGDFLFPGRNGRAHLHPDSASHILRKACQRIGLEGVSTHSFRRTALTQLSNAGIPLRVIQQISGHRTLDELYKYLEVGEEQVRGAMSALSMLTPVESIRGRSIGKPSYVDRSQTTMGEYLDSEFFLPD
jgi:integrase/recombinase XerD